MNNSPARWHINAGGGYIADLEVWVDRFLDDKANADNSVVDQTLVSYEQALQTFVDFAHNDSLQNIQDISSSYIVGYIKSYQDLLANKALRSEKISQEAYSKIMSGESVNRKRTRRRKSDEVMASVVIADEFATTLLHRVTVLKQFLLFVSENNIEQVDLTLAYHRGLPRIKPKKKASPFLTILELGQLVDEMQAWPTKYKKYVPNINEYNAWRNSLLILILALTGMRADEVLHIKLENITELTARDDSGNETDFCIIEIESGKGDKPRHVALPKLFIGRHLAFMRSILPGDDYYISAGYKNGGPTRFCLGQSSLYVFLRDTLTRLGINKSGMHTLRRGYATMRLADGVDVAKVAIELGHKSVSTTTRFYIVNNPELMTVDKHDMGRRFLAIGNKATST